MFRKPEIQFVRDVLWSKKAIVLGFIVLEIGIGLLSVALPFFTKIQIEQLEGKAFPFLQENFHSFFLSFILVVCAVFILKLLEFVFQNIRWIARLTMRFGLGYLSEIKLYEKLQTLDINFLENPRNRRMLHMLLRSKELSENVLQYVGQNIHNIISIVGVFPILALIDVRFFFVVIMSSLLSAYSSQYAMERKNAIDLVQDKLDARTWSIHNALQYQLPALLSIGGEKTLLDQYKLAMQRGYKFGIASAGVGVFFAFLRWIILHSAELFVIISMGKAVIDHQATFATYTMVLMYVSILQSSISDLLEAYPEWIKLRIAFDRLGFFLAIQPRYSMDQVMPLDQELKRTDVSVQGVNFRYPQLNAEEKSYVKNFLQRSKLLGKKTYVWNFDVEEIKNWEELLESTENDSPLVLVDVSCVFKKGTITAIVGKNGSGKTTLSRLLLRNIDPEQGNISFGERDFSTLDPKDIRKHISIVQQSPYILREFTVKENLLLGVDDKAMTDEYIWNILEKVGLTEVIKAHEKGLESLLGDDLRLSGGEEQLLVIARVILQNRPILIFDEGTNQLDAEHEMAILQLLIEMKKDKVILMITHRMTSARKADYIYVLEKGHILEEGTHETLLQSKNGLYTRFWNIQVVE